MSAYDDERTAQREKVHADVERIKNHRLSNPEDPAKIIAQKLKMPISFVQYVLRHLSTYSVVPHKSKLINVREEAAKYIKAEYGSKRK